MNTVEITNVKLECLKIVSRYSTTVKELLENYKALYTLVLENVTTY